MDAPAKRQKKTKTKPDTSTASRPLNPNWALLQQKLNTNPTTTSTNPQKSRVLGKRKERTDEASGDSESNPLIPTSTDFRLVLAKKSRGIGFFDAWGNSEETFLVINKLIIIDPMGACISSGYDRKQMNVSDVIAMDCEMVGVGEGTRNALGRLTLVNKWGNVICDEFVRPLERITDFRTEVSGIRPRDMRKAKDFRIVQKKVADLIKGKVLVGHALHNDLKALLLSHPKKDIRDTSQYHLFQKEGRRSALRHLATEFLGVTIQKGEHCPIEDARAAMLLYQKNHKGWEKSIKGGVRMKQKKRPRIPKRVKMDTSTN